MTRRLFVSPSQLQSLVACERRWYLENQAGVPRDGEGGGQYLVFGRLLDEAVERIVARPSAVLDVADLVATVQADRRRGELTRLDDAKWLELADRAVRQTRRLIAARVLPPTGTPSQFRYRVEVPWAPVTLVGRADYRSPGRIWDLKSTSDRGPGVGPAAGRAPNAKTAESLREDFQARVYAAAEFFADPTRLSVEATWVYASSQSTAVWSVRVVFLRHETIAWFDAHVRPLFPRMLELAETEGLAPEDARANHDSCSRCFVRGSCAPFQGAQQHTGKEYDVDLEKLRARRSAVNRPAEPPPAEKTLEEQLRASQAAARAEADALAAVSESVRAQLMAAAAAVAGGTQDDRRADVLTVVGARADEYTGGMQLVVSSSVPADPLVVETTGVDVNESPAVALREAMAAEAAAPAAAPEPPAKARRGRGRPREIDPPAAPATRAPTADELARVTALDEAGRELQRVREVLLTAALAAIDAAAEARNALRAIGVRFEGDPS